MATISQTQLHRVYLVSQHGDTLVVMPKGDAAGFSLSAVTAEMQVVQAIVESGQTQHLIIDLSSGNYFGSVVLGALIKLGNAVRDRGGRIAMAAPSTDMQDILRLMKLDQMWEMFPDLKSALRAIAKIPVRERLWGQRYVFLFLAIVVLGIAAWQYLPRYRYGRQYYRGQRSLARSRGASRPGRADEWQRLTQKCESRLKPVVAELEATRKRRRLYDAEPFILYAARDHWSKAMERQGGNSQGDRALVQFYIRCAEARLAGRPLPVRFDSAKSGSAKSGKPEKKSSQSAAGASKDGKPAETTTESSSANGE